jgi:hypothetical protein
MPIRLIHEAEFDLETTRVLMEADEEAEIVRSGLTERAVRTALSVSGGGSEGGVTNGSSPPFWIDSTIDGSGIRNASQ